MENLFLYLHYPFVWYALIVAVLVALCASLLGVTLVLKRFSFIGDGLSHVAFGALAVATVFQVTSTTPIVLLITIVCAILLLCGGKNKKLGGDASLAVLSVGALAVGYLLLNLFPGSANISGDVCNALFGSTSLLTLELSDVVLTVSLSAITVLLFVLFYRQIFAVTFDEDFARATGIRTGVTNFFLAIFIAIIIVISMNLAGSLLVSALIIFPALTAMRLFHSFFSVTVCAAVSGVFCAFVGSMASLFAATPVGATIAVVNLLVFVIACVIGKVRA